VGSFHVNICTETDSLSSNGLFAFRGNGKLECVCSCRWLVGGELAKAIFPTLITSIMKSRPQDLVWTDKVKSIHSLMESEEDLYLTNRVLFSHSSNHDECLEGVYERRIVF